MDRRPLFLTDDRTWPDSVFILADKQFHYYVWQEMGQNILDVISLEHLF